MEVLWFGYANMILHFSAKFTSFSPIQGTEYASEILISDRLFKVGFPKQLLTGM